MPNQAAPPHLMPKKQYFVLLTEVRITGRGQVAPNLDLADIALHRQLLQKKHVLDDKHLGAEAVAGRQAAGRRARL